MFSAALSVAMALVHALLHIPHVEAGVAGATRNTHARGLNANYTIAQNFTGAGFFETGWNFQTGPDTLNWGNVIFLNQADAATQGLTYVNSAGNAIIRVDNFTSSTDPTYGRNSIYMVSQGAFTQGSLVLFQAVHMPYGCGIWPGFWSLGGNSSDWPLYGEIDIYENVNMATVNQYSLHTEEGCTRPPPAPGLQSGTAGQADCWNQTAYNTGCITVETKPNNYGAGFAQAGGGAYALQWTDDAMRFWFFPRGSIPPDFDSPNPQPSTWGIPSGLYPQATCDFASHFGPQAIVLDIDICGLYAGEPAIYNAGGMCQGLCTDLIHDPTNFNTAYFEIEFLRVFVESNGTVLPPIPTTTASTSATSTPTVISGHTDGAATHSTHMSFALLASAIMSSVLFFLA